MWRLDGSIAHFETKQLTCCIDLFQPTKGLLNLTVLKQQLLPPEFQILQIHTGETETESTLVVRGSDLVAMYSETKHRQVRVQVYWRWLAQYEQAFGMEVILSVQTSQLDVQTAIETVSMLSTAPEQPCERLYLFALRPIPLMYTEMVHPSNALDSRLLGIVRAAKPVFPRITRKGRTPSIHGAGNVLRLRPAPLDRSDSRRVSSSSSTADDLRLTYANQGWMIFPPWSVKRTLSPRNRCVNRMWSNPTK
jgi:hypothetical protein